VSETEGVALISVPALGAIDVEGRVRKAALDVIDALVGASAEDESERRERAFATASTSSRPRSARRRSATTTRSASRPP
jgi:hypothetical protein